MKQDLSSSNSQLDRAMTCEQFEQVVDAILSGKYSWACVLILRFGGYNPLHYIPYRTYNRLMKQDRSNRQSAVGQPAQILKEKSRASQSQANSATQLRNLNYIEDIKYQSDRITGGNSLSYLEPISV